MSVVSVCLFPWPIRGPVFFRAILRSHLVNMSSLRIVCCRPAFQSESGGGSGAGRQAGNSGWTAGGIQCRSADGCSSGSGWQRKVGWLLNFTVSLLMTNQLHSPISSKTNNCRSELIAIRQFSLKFRYQSVMSSSGEAPSIEQLQSLTRCATRRQAAISEQDITVILRYSAIY